MVLFGSQITIVRDYIPNPNLNSILLSSKFLETHVEFCRVSQFSPSDLLLTQLSSQHNAADPEVQGALRHIILVSSQCSSSSYNALLKFKLDCHSLNKVMVTINSYFPNLLICILNSHSDGIGTACCVSLSTPHRYHKKFCPICSPASFCSQFPVENSWNVNTNALSHIQSHLGEGII